MNKLLISNNEFPTLVALTAEEQAKGLMGVKPPVPIMTFPFKEAGEHRFWMKSTPAALDIIHCRNNKVVHICYGEPYSTKMVGPRFATDMVVEMPYGSTKKYNISVGDDVRLVPTLSTIARQIVA